MIRVFNVSVAPVALLIAVFETLLLFSAFSVATIAVGSFDPGDYLLHDSGLVAISLVVLTFLLGLQFQDLYTRLRVKSRVLLLQQLCMATGATFVVEGLINYLDSDLRISVRVMLVGCAMVVPSLFLVRLFFSSLGGQMLPQTKLILVGHSAILSQLEAWIEEHPEAGIVVERAVGTIHEMLELEELARQRQAPQLIFGGWRATPELIEKVLDLRLAGYEVQTAAAAYERASGKVSLYSLHPHRLIDSNVFAPAPKTPILQVLLNESVAAFCLLVATPIVLASLLVLRLSGTAVVWCSESLTGLNGRVFRAYHFRMSGQGAVARAMRKLQFDRLPRLLSVIRGDLAMVGPRPERPEYDAAIGAHIPFYRERYRVRPGMTGWAQVHLDLIPEIEDTAAKLEYDLYYIKNRSVGLDSLILLHTIKSMLMPSPRPAEVWTEAKASAGNP